MALLTIFDKARGVRIGDEQPFPVVYSIVFWPLFALYLVYCATSMLLFYFFAVKRSDRSLTERSLYLTSLETGFALLFGVNAFLRTALPLYPCFLDIWVVYVGYISWLLAVTLIMLRYYLSAKSHQALAAGIRKVPVTPSNIDHHLQRLLALYKDNAWAHTNDGSSESYSQSKENSVETASGAACQAQDEAVDYVDPVAQVRAPSATVNAARQLSAQSIQEIAPFADAPSPTLLASRPRESLFSNQPTLPDVAHQRVKADIASCGRRQRWQKDKRRRNLLPKRFNRANALRRLKSRRFLTYAIATELAITFVLLVFLTSFAKQMSLRRVQFNCSRGWEYYIVMSISLLFSIIICPLFLFKTWNLKDEYGIRASLAVSSVVGTLSWIGGLVWRTVHPPADYYISTSIFFLLQIIAVHTCIVAYPVVKSIIFAKKQRAGMQDTERGREYGRTWALDIPQTEYDLSKQSFLIALRDAAEHEKIEKFAMSCFCGELISFLDIFIALKRSIYLVIRQGELSAQAALPLSIAGKAPSRRFSNSSFDKQPLLPLPVYSPQSRANGVSVNGLEEAGEPVHMPMHRRLSTMLTSTFSRRSNTDVEQEYLPSHVVETEELQDLSSLSVGITQTMQQAFSELSISESTVLPESLRNTVNTIIRTFMLPDSPLAINAPSTMVATCRAYLAGGRVTFGMLDRAKDEVIDMLYSNVYLRYRK